MCPPDHFEVSYAINEFMEPDAWAKDADRLSALARSEWDGLVAAIERAGGTVETLPPAKGLPDLVFTANAAVVLDGRVLEGRYRAPERAPEEPLVSAWFAKHFSDCVKQREGAFQEGLGDSVWDPVRQCFWAGWGPRSSLESHDAIRTCFGAQVRSLKLVSSRFYHLDVCLMPLSGGEILYFPEAFDADGLAEIQGAAGDMAIAVSAEDAGRLAVNAVEIDGTIILSGCSEGLRARLETRGYEVVETHLTTFAMSGGGAFCLTLRLDLARG